MSPYIKCAAILIKEGHIIRILLDVNSKSGMLNESKLSNMSVLPKIGRT